MKTYLVEKLAWEWKIFSLDMLKQSKERLFMEADMIATKKELYQLLKNMELSETEENRLLAMDHILDFFYLNCPTERIAVPAIRKILSEPSVSGE